MTVPLFVTKPKLALLDWDGTFCDSRESIYEINLVMAKHYGKVMPSYKKWLSASHPGVEVCMRSIGVTEDRESVNAFFNQLLVELRDKEDVLQNPLYEGTRELLCRFAELGIPAIVISRHLHNHLVLDIEAHGLSHFFQRVIGEPKGVDLVKEAEIRKLCEEFGIAQDQTFYLGDTVHDILAANKAGVIAAAITHGYDPRSRLEKESKPDLIVDSLAEFQALLA